MVLGVGEAGLGGPREMGSGSKSSTTVTVASTCSSSYSSSRCWEGAEVMPAHSSASSPSEPARVSTERGRHGREWTNHRPRHSHPLSGGRFRQLFHEARGVAADGWG